MPNIADNTATQNLTTSDGGTNKMPKLDAKSYFYIEDGDFAPLQNTAFYVADDVYEAMRVKSVIAELTSDIVKGIFNFVAEDTNCVSLTNNSFRADR